MTNLNPIQSYCRNSLVLISICFLSACAALPAKKAKDIYCPANSDGELIKPLDAMPISVTEAVLVCGHREDTRSAKRMRVSETEIFRYNLEKDTHASVWSTGALDVRYVQLLPKKKQIEIVWPVFDKESKPIPILREIMDCQKSTCEMTERKCVYQKQAAVTGAVLPGVKNLRKWLQEEDSVDRATVLLLTALNGEKKSLEVLRDKQLPKLSTDGFFQKTMGFYNQLLDETQKLCPAPATNK